MNISRQYGFTLLELLAAMAVFAVLSMMTFSGLNHVLDAREQLESERLNHQGIIMAMMRIEDDFTQCRNRPVRLADGNPSPAFVGREPDSRSLGAPTIECSRGGHAIVGRNPASDLVRVGYRLNDEQRLVRVIWSVLDRAPQTLPREQLVMENVESFSLRYFHHDKWYRTWPLEPEPGKKTEPVPLPEGIEFTLKQTDRPEIQRLIRING